MDLIADQIFDERYKIVRELGRGAAGRVYLALDKLLDQKEVALKILEPDATFDAKTFIAEVNATREVHSKNIVKLNEVGKTADAYYLVLEYLSGGSLSDLIKQQPFALGEFLNKAIDVATGVAAIHEANFLHRDLKPDNILIDHQGTAKISDFGIASILRHEIISDDQQLTPELTGTTHYLAPEVWQDNTFSEQSDLYALGVILYEYCCGTKPFTGETSTQIMYQHVEGSLIAPRELNAAVPPALSNLIEDLLSANPLNRPAIEELLSAFESARDNLDAEHTATTDLQSDQPSARLDKSDSTTADQQGLDFLSVSAQIQGEKKRLNPNFGQKNLELSKFRRNYNKLRCFVQINLATTVKLLVYATFYLAVFWFSDQIITGGKELAKSVSLSPLSLRLTELAFTNLYLTICLLAPLLLAYLLRRLELKSLIIYTVFSGLLISLLLLIWQLAYAGAFYKYLIKFSPATFETFFKALFASESAVHTNTLRLLALDPAGTLFLPGYSNSGPGLIAARPQVTVWYLLNLAPFLLYSKLVLNSATTLLPNFRLRSAKTVLLTTILFLFLVACSLLISWLDRPTQVRADLPGYFWLIAIPAYASLVLIGRYKKF